MYKVALWGIGDGYNLFSQLKGHEMVEVVVITDRNCSHISTMDGKPVVEPRRLKEYEFDYLVVSVIDDKIYKLIIESIFVFFIYIFTHNAFVIAVILGAIKIIVTLLTKGIINKVYFKLKVYWYQNSFFIRYIFDIIMFVYIIVSCVFLVLNRMGV